ncbi:ASCH domain-containing protein [uncultured Massilia sp.]|uniref:ASCH domain-containing protein n=1 Tax=uncultured Massilia sp. TaxID=169973 RepID=UPI0025F2BAE9|nr:ASCH domain-containing protein [uncultured Massilia sp.]
MAVRKRLTFWSADPDDDSLVRDVIAGRKTATADLVEDYYRGYGALGEGGYAAGELVDVLDPRGRRRCTIRATRVRRILFGAIPEDVWRAEGFDSARAFQDCHVACMPDKRLDDATEFVALHFELVEVAAVE